MSVICRPLIETRRFLPVEIRQCPSERWYQGPQKEEDVSSTVNALEQALDTGAAHAV